MSWPGSSTNTPQLAGWWYRVGASLIDGIIVGVVSRIIGIAGNGVYYTVLIIGNLLYTALLLNARGQTVGMMALGTRCVDQQTGGPIGTGRAFGRTGLAIALQVTVVGWVLDVLWPLWDTRNQTLHDKAVGSLVVLTRSRTEVSAPPFPASGTFGGWGQGGGWQSAPGREGAAPSPGPGPGGWSPAPAPSPEPSVPAAWYPDPGGSGQERWWDGKSWTDHLRAPS